MLDANRNIVGRTACSSSLQNIISLIHSFSNPSGICENASFGETSVGAVAAGCPAGLAKDGPAEAFSGGVEGFCPRSPVAAAVAVCGGNAADVEVVGVGDVAADHEPNEPP